MTVTEVIELVETYRQTIFNDEIRFYCHPDEDTYHPFFECTVVPSSAINEGRWELRTAATLSPNLKLCKECKRIGDKYKRLIEERGGEVDIRY